MKTVLLLRHGKSDWKAIGGRDHERPLAKRGRNAASLIGTFLAQVDQVPGRVLTSTAVRAEDTVRRAAKAGRWACPIETVPELYEASPADVLDVIRRADDSVDRLLLAGHEPTWSEVAGRFVGGACVRFPTAAVARIDLAIERWASAEFGGGELVWFLPPRLLTDMG